LIRIKKIPDRISKSMTGLELALKRSSDSAQNIAAEEFAAKVLKRLVLRMPNGSPAGAAKSILRVAVESLRWSAPFQFGMGWLWKTRLGITKAGAAKSRLTIPKLCD
jgi:hypothetical protein